MVLRHLLYMPFGEPGLKIPELTPYAWSLRVATDISVARGEIATRRYFVGLASVTSADSAALAEMQTVLASDAQMEWIALVPNDSAMRHRLASFITRNFHDYHTTPADPSRLSQSLGHAYGMAKLREDYCHEAAARGSEQFEMVGKSAQMQAVYRAIPKLASADAPVLITGESGTGKELAALAIHKCSRRSEAPFVAVNCAALPRNLIQSELFGHEKGAFTDAHVRRIGRIEGAIGGTIFLDEVGDLPLDLQVNLLRFLQEKTIERVGGTRSIPVDVRIIAATNVALEDKVQAGQFRADLYFRLNVLRLTVPPLRERDGDVELLARFFLDKFAQEERVVVRDLSYQALRTLNSYDWPGNVRELINRIRRAVVMCDERVISPADLGLEKRQRQRRIATLEQSRASAEQQAISSALRRNSNNVTQAAYDLGVSRMTLYRLMHTHHLLKSTSSSHREADLARERGRVVKRQRT